LIQKLEKDHRSPGGGDPGGRLRSIRIGWRKPSSEQIRQQTCEQATSIAHWRSARSDAFEGHAKFGGEAGSNMVQEAVIPGLWPQGAAARFSK
jgi:hypothetical protein